jgi:hypothetical protein
MNSKERCHEIVMASLMTFNNISTDNNTELSKTPTSFITVLCKPNDAALPVDHKRYIKEEAQVC